MFSWFKRVPRRWRGGSVDMVKRRAIWGVTHYGEVLHGKQRRLKIKIRERLICGDYRCRLPDAAHPTIKVKMRREYA